MRGLLKMGRRGALGVLAGIAGNALAPSLAPAIASTVVSAAARSHATREVVLLDSFIAGTAYYEWKDARNWLEVGDELQLRREPGNIHDARAIEVLTAGGVKLGYVPRADNQPIAALMDAGQTLTARLTATGRDRYAPARFAIRMTV